LAKIWAAFLIQVANSPLIALPYASSLYIYVLIVQLLSVICCCMLNLFTELVKGSDNTVLAWELATV